MIHTIVTLVRDRPGVLNRAVSLFRRRGLNIESLTVTRSDREGISRITWTVDMDNVTQIMQQLDKLIDVLEVRQLSSPESSPTEDSSRSDAAVPTSPTAITQADGVA
jgi:acetolactate synthase-1/3 small subunit